MRRLLITAVAVIAPVIDNGGSWTSERIQTTSQNVDANQQWNLP
jgi:hypothetical protein